MKFRVLIAAVAFLALTALGYGQFQVSFDYPGDWDCVHHNPLTYNAACWQGTPIPDGTTIQILRNGAAYGTYPMNSEFVCGSAVGGFFSTAYFDIYPGETVQAKIQLQNCTYLTPVYTPTSDNTYELTEADWTCQCGQPGCEVKEEQGSLLRDNSKSGGSSSATGTSR